MGCDPRPLPARWRKVNMRLSLRWRIFLTLVPLLLLLTLLGGAGAALLYHLGSRIDAILQENYRSVIYMERLNEALERIDSSFQFALASTEQEERARSQYQAKWPAYLKNLQLERENVTLPGEQEMVDELDRLTDRYRQQGDVFYRLPAGSHERKQAYFGQPDDPGLLDLFTEIKAVSAEI